MDPKAVAVIGKRLLSTKWYSTSMHWLWIYDYFLTLGDEVSFAWSGRKSGVFLLFVANRYLPVLHIIYKGIIQFDYTVPLCERTKWELTFYTTVAAILAQLTVAIRLYAVSWRNKSLGCTLALLILGQTIAGLWLTVKTAIAPVQQVPSIDLDPFKACLNQQWRPGEISFITIAVTFDTLALSVALVAAKGSKAKKRAGISDLFDTILQDASIYFLLMFACQSLLLFFLFLAPVQIQLLPGVTHMTFLPMMACRLMLSLKKAACEPEGLWTLSHTPAHGRRSSISTGIEFIIHPMPQPFDVSHEISDALVSSSGVDQDMELAPVPRSPRGGGFK